MGRRLKILATDRWNATPVFPNRFVVECCETFHIHFKNFRIECDTESFRGMCEAFNEAKNRLQNGAVEPSPQAHVELGRCCISQKECNSSGHLTVELCENLYRTKFRDQTNFNDRSYIHIHIGEIRLELTISEFEHLCDVLSKALHSLKATGTVSLARRLEGLNDAGVQYVVLRNWDGLPAFPNAQGHPDLDVLVADGDRDALIRILDLEKNRPEKYREQYVTLVPVDGELRELLVDVRTPSSNYLPRSLATSILSRRRLVNGFYVPEERDWYNALLYHAAYHKGYIPQDYVDRLDRYTRETGYGLCRDRLFRLSEVREFLKQSGIQPVIPCDPSVAAWIPNDQDDFPLDRDRIAGRVLCVLDGKPIYSRVFAYNEQIIKEVTEPLAANEAAALARLKQWPWFPRLLEYRSYGEYGRLRMEKLPGIHPSGAVFRRMGLRYGILRKVCFNCVKLLQALQLSNVIHSDIRDQNLLISPGGQVFLLDFGWAKHPDSPRTTLPPRIAASQATGARCDMVGMGSLLLKMCGHWREFQPLISAMLRREGVDTAELLSIAEGIALQPSTSSLIRAVFRFGWGYLGRRARLLRRAQLH